MTKFLEFMNFDISFSNFHINTYFCFVASGIVVACLLLVYRDKSLKKYRQDLFFCFLYAFVGIVIGSKLLYILSILKYLIADPSLWLHVLEGGLLFYGGVIGGFIGALLYIRQYDMPMWDFFDNAAVSIPIGHAIGRWGCLVQGCCHGKPTNCAFGITYPSGNLIAPSLVKIHPVQLYESCANIIIFIILLNVYKKTDKKGLPLGLYFILYGIVRFALDYFRADYNQTIWLLTQSQFISVIMIIIGSILVFGKWNIKIQNILCHKRKKS